jgi:hypothetical protein
MSIFFVFGEIVDGALGSSVEIPMAEGPVNLNWGQIMKTINDNPLEFFRDGGWTFLGGTGAEGSDKVCVTILLSLYQRLNPYLHRAVRTIQTPSPNLKLRARKWWRAQATLTKANSTKLRMQVTMWVAAQKWMMTVKGTIGTVSS